MGQSHRERQKWVRAFSFFALLSLCSVSCCQALFTWKVSPCSRSQDLQWLQTPLLLLHQKENFCLPKPVNPREDSDCPSMGRTPISWTRPVARGMSYSDQPKPRRRKEGTAQDHMKSSQRNLEKGRWKRTTVNYTSCYTKDWTIYSIPSCYHWRYRDPERGQFDLHKVTLYLHSRSIDIMKWTWYKIILLPHARVIYKEGRKRPVYHDAGYEPILLGFVTPKNEKRLRSDCLAGFL